MLKRIVAGSILIVILITALALGGWWFTVPFMICVSLSAHEVFRALQNAGSATKKVGIREYSASSKLGSLRKMIWITVSMQAPAISARSAPFCPISSTITGIPAAMQTHAGH